MSDLLKMTPAEFCDATDACNEGCAFALKQVSMADVWDNCPRADWLVWVVEKLGQRPDDRTLRLFAVWCARNTPLVDGRKTGDLITDPRSIAALEVSERFANGQASRTELKAAEDAAATARAAAWAAAEDAAATARAAAWAAAWDAAPAAAPAAAWAAAWDAAPAAARAAGDAAREAARAAQADHFRTLVKNPFQKEAQP